VLCRHPASKTALALVAALAGVTACTPADPSAAPDGSPSSAATALPTTGAAAPTGPATPTAPTAPTGSAGRSDLAIELDCYLVENATYSAGRGATPREAVADLTRWYPPISRIARWPDPTRTPDATATTQPGASAAASADATAASGTPVRADPSIWLLYTASGRGYGTATAGRPDPDSPEWVASVNQLCVAAQPPGPARYTDLTSQGATSAESLDDPANAGFRAAMSGAIVGLAEGDAADALRAAGWRVRVGERDGVTRDNAGSSASWINLAISGGTVTGFTIG
jgi:hypothetical protein